MPAAPPRFSTTNGWPSFSVIFCARMRAEMSEPPGAKGTIMRTVRLGYDSAAPAGSAKNSSARSTGVHKAASTFKPSFGLDAQLAHPGDVGFHGGRELLRGIADDFHAAVRQALLQLGAVQNSHDFLVEAIDDRRRRFRRRHERLRRYRFVARQSRSRQGRQAWKQGGRQRAANRETLQLVLLDVGPGRRRPREHELDLASHDAEQPWPAALVGDAYDIDARHG